MANRVTPRGTPVPCKLGESDQCLRITRVTVDSTPDIGSGEMAEWLKAHAWKACIPQGIQGSNPCLSATYLESTT
jgi:hypothetical protein